MKSRHFRVVVLSCLALIMSACTGNSAPTSTPAPTKVVRLAYAASAQSWLDQVIIAFNNQRQADASGNIIQIEGTPLASGAMIEDMVTGDLKYDAVLPDDKLWIDLLAARRQERGQPAIPFGTCTAVARTPVVMVTWRSMAEVLGWPEREFTWNDITDLALSPSAWSGYDRPEWGTLTFGHAHPVLSNGGLLALMGESYAAGPLTNTDISTDAVKSYVRAVERSVSRYGSDSTALITTMAQRGPRFLHVAIGYESDVVGVADVAPSGSANDRLVAIYPTETFVAEYTLCPAGNNPAVDTFKTYLLSDTEQRVALSAGFRPVSSTVPLAAPVAVNATYKTIPMPQLPVIRSIQDQWSQVKRSLNITMAIDVSGSMNENNKMETAKAGAKAFVGRMGDDDLLTLYTFTDVIKLVVNRQRVGDNRQQILDLIGQLKPLSQTSLYEAVVVARTQMKIDSTRINTVIVLTDGKDTVGKYQLPQALNLIKNAKGNATIYTIGFGSDVDKDKLQQIADAGNGLYFAGDPATISQVYLEIATQVGGSRGLGR